MKFAWSLVVLGLSACVTPIGAPVDEQDNGVVVETSTTPKTSTPLAPNEVCANDGEFGLFVSGDGLAAWEGHRVFVAALEQLGPEQTLIRQVLQSDVITNGSFGVACTNALRENYNYPSWAAFIDVDNDGRCTGNDIASQMMRYGWNRDEIETVPANEWYRVDNRDNRGLWTTFGVPHASMAEGFCASYFE